MTFLSCFVILCSCSRLGCQPMSQLIHKAVQGSRARDPLDRLQLLVGEAYVLNVYVPIRSVQPSRRFSKIVISHTFCAPPCRVFVLKWRSLLSSYTLRICSYTFQVTHDFSDLLLLFCAPPTKWKDIFQSDTFLHAPRGSAAKSCLRLYVPIRSVQPFR